MSNPIIRQLTKVFSRLLTVTVTKFVRDAVAKQQQHHRPFSQPFSKVVETTSRSIHVEGGPKPFTGASRAHTPPPPPPTGSSSASSSGGARFSSSSSSSSSSSWFSSKVFLGGAAGFLAGVCYTLATLPVRPPTKPNGTPTTQSTGGGGGDAITLGTALLQHRRVGESFTAEFDATHRNPRFVAERYTAASLQPAPGLTRDGHDFKEEAALPPTARARLSAYVGSGYDRGHLAPAAAHKHSATELADTFYLSNIAPQNPSLNRDYWARLEKWCRGLVVGGGAGGGGAGAYQSVNVITGPLYLPTPSTTTPSGWEYTHPALGAPYQWVSVPTHFFKVVVAHKGGESSPGVAVAAFLIPNKPIPTATPLMDFVVPVGLLEAVSGLKLAPSALSPQDIHEVDEECDRAVEGGRGVGVGGKIFAGSGGKKQQKKGVQIPSKPESSIEGGVGGKARFLCWDHSCDLPSSLTEAEH